MHDLIGHQGRRGLHGPSETQDSRFGCLLGVRIATAVYERVEQREKTERKSGWRRCQENEKQKRNSIEAAHNFNHQSFWIGNSERQRDE